MGSILKKMRVPAYALPVALMGGLYWLSFYPAIMTYDSLDQWQQVVSGKFNDWHPVASTLLIDLARFFWDSPAAMVVLQIIALSLVVGWGFAVIEDLSVPRWAVWFACFLFSISPLNGAFIVTIWKDIPYGITVLALTIIMARIVMTNGRWLAGRIAWIFMGLLLAICMLVRHNGFAAALGAFLALTVCYRRYWRAILGALLLCVGVFLLFKGPVCKALKVEKGAIVVFDRNCQMRYFAVMACVAAHVAARTPMEAPERDYLNEIQPLEPVWYYDEHYDGNTHQFNRFSWQVINCYPRQVLRSCFVLTMRRPWVSIRHFLAHSETIWCPWQATTNLVLNTGVYSTPEQACRITYISPPKMAPELRQAPKLPWLFEKLARLLFVSQAGEWNIWQSSNYLYLFLLGVAWASWRARNAKVLILAAPLLLHTAILLVFITAPQSRYQYPVFLITHVFWMGLFFGRFPMVKATTIQEK